MIIATVLPLHLGNRHSAVFINEREFRAIRQLGIKILKGETATLILDAAQRIVHRPCEFVSVAELVGDSTTGVCLGLDP